MQARRQIYQQASKPGIRKPRLGNFSQNRGRDWGKRSVSHSCIRRKSHFVRCDASARFNYNWNRYYAPTTAKYITSDPVGLNAGVNSYQYVFQNPNIFVDRLGLMVGGQWVKEPHVDQGSIHILYKGLEGTLGIDKYASLLLLSINYYASANIVASVRCEDQCRDPRSLNYNKRHGYDGNIRVGPNIIASLGSYFYGVPVGIVLNAIIIDLKLNEGLKGISGKLEAKAASLKAYGADFICEYGWLNIQ